MSCTMYSLHHASFVPSNLCQHCRADNVKMTYNGLRGDRKYQVMSVNGLQSIALFDLHLSLVKAIITDQCFTFAIDFDWTR
jgi:hypothetical protein